MTVAMAIKPLKKSAFLLVEDLHMNLYAFHLGQIIVTF